MMTTAVIRVLLVDDHTVVSDGLKALLSQFDDIEVVGAASSGRAAVELCASVRPDVVLMDLSMPGGMNGAEATERILAATPEVQVIALTGYLDDELVRAAIEAGASGYLLKTLGGEDLAQAVRSAAMGRGTISLEALPHMTGAEARPAPLTHREFDVLKRLVEGDSNKEIARHLSLSPGTIRVHVSNILAKLGVDNRTAATRYALRHGLITEARD